MTRLYIAHTSDIYGTDDLGLILLATEDGHSGITVVAERNVVEQLRLRQAGKVNTDNRLPEVLYKVIRRNTDADYRILFTGFQDEKYIVFLYDETHSQAYQLRASDAVLLAFIANLPIVMEDNLFRRQAQSLNNEINSIRIPVTSLNDDILKKMLERAVDEERFEYASYIRDELRRRETAGIA